MIGLFRHHCLSVVGWSIDNLKSPATLAVTSHRKAYRSIPSSPGRRRLSGGWGVMNGPGLVMGFLEIRPVATNELDLGFG